MKSKMKELFQLIWILESVCSSVAQIATFAVTVIAQIAKFATTAEAQFEESPVLCPIFVLIFVYISWPPVTARASPLSHYSYIKFAIRFLKHNFKIFKRC
jgi:hypothetical protein